MELLLNLVWLAAAVLITGLVVPRIRCGSSSRERWLLGIAALCLLVVLFPAISITDDLQQVSFASGENTQVLILADMHAQFYANVQFLSLLMLLLLFQSMLATFEFHHRTYVVASPLNGILRSAISRPPPSLLS